MKKRILLLSAIVLLLLAVIIFIVCRYNLLPNYETPFQSEEVMSVTVSTFYEAKTIEDKAEIENLITQLNKVKIIFLDQSENCL